MQVAVGFATAAYMAPRGNEVAEILLFIDVQFSKMQLLVRAMVNAQPIHSAPYRDFAVDSMISALSM